MRYWLLGSMLALFVMILPAGAAPPARSAEKPGSSWLSDYGQARQLGRQSGRPLLVVFR